MLRERWRSFCSRALLRWLVVSVGVACVTTLPAHAAAPSFVNFSFKLTGDRVLQCSLNTDLGAGSPAQARCDGYTAGGRAQGFNGAALHGGNRAEISVE